MPLTADLLLFARAATRRSGAPQSPYRRQDLVQQVTQQVKDAELVPGLGPDLGLTDEQKEKVRSLQAKAREERGGRQGGDRSEEGRKKREEARKALYEQLMNVLTAEQKAKMKELAGEPFTGEIRRPQFGGRNRPGR